MMKFLRSLRTKEYNFMAPKVSALSQKPHSFASITLILIGALITIFLIWASFAEIDVVTRGNGHVIASQKNQIIAHLEGGIIKKVLVDEGDLVEAGQVLMVIDPTVAIARYEAHRENYLRYLAAVERLQAQIDEEEYHVPEEVQKEAPLIADEEMLRYLERQDQVDTQKDIAKKAIIQKQQEIAEQQEKMNQAQDQLTLSEEEVKMVAPLVVEQLISKREILRLKRDTANLKGEVAAAKEALAKNQAALEQAQFELDNVENRFQNEDYEQLRDIKIKLEEERANLLEAQDRMTRTDMRSPVKGIVRDIKIRTVGGVVRGGEEIMQIVPFEDTLLVEANILPSDVAFLHPGQKASVKITAYDYAIYGSLDGKLLEISADTVHDPEQRKDFYRVFLRTDKNYLEHEEKKLPIIPGMTVEVDILTGSRTVMEYMLKPIIKGFSTAFKER
jgi:adhesin transport system membrane fusion protein